MKKIVLSMVMVFSGALISISANSSSKEPGPRLVVKSSTHASKGLKKLSALPIRSERSKKVLNKEFNIPLNRKIHHGEVQLSKGFGIPLKRKTYHGEIQAKKGFTIPLKRKVHQAGAVKNNFHIPLRRIKHSSADVGKDLAED
jgi:hypothetical protein